MSSGSKLIRKEPCPECRKEGKDASGNNLAVYDDGHSWCYSCNYFKSVAQEDFNTTKDTFTYEFLPWRGVTADTFRHYNCKTKIGADGKPVSIGFIYPNASYKVRSLIRKEFYSIGEINKAGLFGRDKFSLGTHKYVTITEGELDALSYYQVLRAPVVSVQSSSSAVRDCSVDRDWLNSFERIYLAFDTDSVGKAAAGRVAKLFDCNKVYMVRLARKDANEHLSLGEEDELRNIWWNAKKYLPENIVSSFSEFKTILTEPLAKGIPYPFPTLTTMTYGIRTSESVLITAPEGVGKTELMHAIEYQLLKETDNEVGAIFLEEPKRRHLQAISGLELRKPVHLPDSGCSESEVLAALQAAISRDERLHIYSHFGSDDPEVILDTIRFLVTSRSCRYILLDHISMVVSALAGDDERKALDYLSTRLEMLVKELDFALIVVSHVNDYGQTRGSRYISKVADIRIDLRRDLLSADPIERNTTYFTVSKNRYCGRTGPAGAVLFDPVTYTYREISNDVPELVDSSGRVLGLDMEVSRQGTQEAGQVTSGYSANDNSSIRLNEEAA